VSGPFSVTNAGGTTTTSGSFTVDPKIASFSPTSGPTGTTVTLAGSGFGGADRVDFGGGVSGVPTNVTPQSLKIVVPHGAATGALTVHTAAGSSPPSAASFTVTFSVTGISPTFGDYGQDVTITGVGLTGITAVTFNGLNGTIQPGGTATTVHVHAPASGNATGHVIVWKATVGVQAPQDFTLLVLASFAPTSGVPGRQIVLTGHGFTGATSVSFNGAAAGFVVNNDGQITATVPAAATSGPISVTVPAGTVSSGSTFTVSRVKVNEFSTGTTADGTDEFVELLNTGSAAADIGGCNLTYSDGSTETVLATLPAAQMLAAGGYYVFGGNGYTGSSDQSFGQSIDLSSAAGGLALTCGSGNTVSDTVGWGAAPSAYVEGTATAAPPADQSAARVPDGADTGDNSADFQLDTTPTPGAQNP
jgi:hypothetical protein